MEYDTKFAPEHVYISSGNTPKIESSDLTKAIFQWERSVQCFEQTTLTTSRFADEVGEFPFANGQANVLENNAAVRLTDVCVGEFNDVLHDQFGRIFKITGYLV